MKLHELRYFLALSETLNFTRAAELCNVSQPALTRAIRNLEDTFGGGPLINRERGNTHLTELGRIMLPHFEEVASKLGEARDHARSYARLGRAVLGIGLLCTIGPARLVGLFADFARRHPEIEIHLEDGPLERIEDRLLEGAVDLALLARPEGFGERLHGVPLFRERFVVALAPGDSLARQCEIRMRDLDGRNYLGRRHCEYYEHLYEARQRLGGVEFRRPYSSERDDWIQAMVLAGLGFTYLPEFAAAMPALVTRLLVEPAVSRSVELVTVRGRPHAPAVGAFLRAARAHPWGGKVEGPAARHPDALPA